MLYADTKVGRYRPDILACDKILLELKAVEALLPIHEAQVLSYLRVAGLPLALLINFGASDVQVERRILTGDVQRREPPERNRPYPGGLERLPHPELLWAIGNCVRRVHFTIGTGFLFHIYENALAVEMGIQGVPYERVKYLPVSFDGEVVGQDRVHLLVVGGRVLVVPLTVGTIGPTERKAARKRLLALGIELALLVNFHDTSAVTQVVQV